MKYSLLATTALVALSSPAFAEITISGTARIGLVTTEGAAAIAADSTFNMLTDDALFVEAMDGVRSYMVGAYSDLDSTGATIDATITIDITPNTEEMTQVETLRTSIAEVARLGATSTLRANAKIDLASIDAIIARTNATTNAAVAKASDTTVGKNRVRIAFAGSGTTDGGLTYGFSARADHSNTSTGGSQYISGAFGKLSMGDLNGGDEQMVGNLSGVGSSGAGSHQEFAYQSSAHNIGYSVSMAGVSFAATTDLVRGADATKTGSNTAWC
jgi:outer membrane protein OmpU